MPAITVGFSEFEARLDRIRRRLNGQELLQTACTSACTGVLAAAAIIVADSTLTPLPAAWVRRTAVAATILVSAGALWRLHSRWFNLETTARFVDRSAGMEDRVATLLAHPSAEDRSPLRAILLWQIFNRSAQWEVERVAPRRLRRPAMVTVAALTALALAVMWAPDGSTGSDDATNAKAPPAEAGSPDAQSVAASQHVSATSTRTGEESSSRIMSEGDGRNPDLGDGHQNKHPGEGHETEHRGNQAVEQSAGAGGTEGERNEDDTRRNKADAPPSRSSEQLDEEERTQPEQPGRAPDNKTPTGARRASSAKEIDRPREANQLPRVGDVTAQRRSADISAQVSPSGTPSTQGPNHDGTDGGSKARLREEREGIDANARGPLGKKASAAGLQGDKQAESMVIQLKSFAANRVEHYEPQGKAGETREKAGDSLAKPAPIASDQVEDSLFHRSAVTRAHQHLLRDLFTPD